MRYLPAFMDVAGQRVVIVGDGEKAIQKLRFLSNTEASVVVVAANPDAELRQQAEAQGALLVDGSFDAGQLDGARLAFVARDEPGLVATVSAAATARGIPLNVVDMAESSTFIVPAIVNRDPIVIAIGSEGTAPVLAREIRRRIEAFLPARLGEVALQADRLRERVRQTIREPLLRRRFWERLLGGAWRDAILSGQTEDADAHLGAALGAVSSLGRAVGRVSLVGAGPGDPDLLTLKAQQRLQEADVIVIDGLVPDVILDHARRDAIRIRAGKEGYGVSTDQGEINRILVREAAKGHRVVRLKGGDPFVFGRAAEEMAAVRAAGIPVEIVPGVTAAHACAASIGLPLTLRQKVRQFSVVTGATGTGLPDLDWRALARPGHAFAIYMGLRSAPDIVSRLLAEGAAPGLTVVVVENGTRPDERVIETTLANLPEALERFRVTGPAVIFVGLDWEAAHLSRPSSVVRFEPTDRYANGHANRHVPGERQWSPEEIALATHWVAG